MHSKPTSLNNQKGLALFIALMVLLIVSIAGIAMVKSTSDEVSIAGNELHDLQAFYVAEGGISLVEAILDSISGTDWNCDSGDCDLGGSEILDNYTLAYTVTSSPLDTCRLSDGPLMGLDGQVNWLTANCIGTSLNNGSQYTITQEYAVADVPIFQFAAYSDSDLYLYKDNFPNLVLTGPIHTNGSMFVMGCVPMFLGGGALGGAVTAGGNIYNRQPDSTTSPPALWDNAIWFQGRGFPNWQQLTQDCFNNPNWYDFAYQTWDNRVRTEHFEQAEHRLKLWNRENIAYKMIQRQNDAADINRTNNDDTYEAGSLNNPSGVNIMSVGEAIDVSLANGVNINANVAGLVEPLNDVAPSDLIRDSIFFFDRRDQRWANIVDVDLAALMGLAAVGNANVFYFSDHREPDNWPTAINGALDKCGGLGISDTCTGDIQNPFGAFRAFRIINSANLPRPVTVVSENPLYIQGDFNAINRQPAALICDALTFLSNEWQDDSALAACGTTSGGTAVCDILPVVTTQMIVNAAVMSGRRPDDAVGGVYWNGVSPGAMTGQVGFLENWGGLAGGITWAGSVVDLWDARQAIGNFHITDGTIIPPDNPWTFELGFRSGLANLPPESPRLLSFYKTAWQPDLEVAEAPAPEPLP